MSWVSPLDLTVYRAVPSPGGKAGGLSGAGIGGAIVFGEKSKGPKKLSTVPFKDLYYSEKLAVRDEEPDILGGKVEVSKVTPYSPTKPVNYVDGLNVWDVYRIRDLKRILSAYIGAPVTHIVFSWADDKDVTTISEALLPAKTFPSELYIFLYGDWPNAKELGYWPPAEGEWTASVSISERASTLRSFARREEIFQQLVKHPYKMSGDVTQTILSSRPKGRYIINGERLFILTPLDPLDGFEVSADATPGHWLIALGYLGRGVGEKASIKALRRSRVVPSHLQPDREGEVTGLLLVRNKDVGVHSYRISMYDDFSIRVSSNWTLSPEKAKREVFLRNSEDALKYFLARIYRNLEDDVMDPAYSFPDRKSFESALSISSYREEYSGGDFEAFKTIVSKMAQAELVRITYLTSTSIYFQCSKGSSRDRVLELQRYIRGRLKSISDDFGCVWCVPELVADVASFLSKGPEVQIKSEEKEIFVTISNCNGDEEIQIVSSYIGRIAAATKYKSSRGSQSSERARDYANLNLLEQIDPILFGSRPMPGGKRINFSRECQGAKRHPVPVSLEEAKKSGSSAIVVNNFTYGGPQAYKCVHKDFPFISLRSKVFGTDCTMCCVQQEIPSDSLKAGEQSMCLRGMLFDTSSLDPSVVAPLLSAKPLQFNGQQLPEGRLASFPTGVREKLPGNVYLYNPPGVDCQDINDVIQWATGGIATGADRVTSITRATGTPCLSCMGATLEDRLMDYVAFGSPIFAIRLTPTSTKNWRAAFLDVGGLMEQSPYVIATWTMTPTSPAINFYPVVSKEGAPILLDDLNLKIERTVDRETLQLFTYDVLVNRIGCRVHGLLLRGGICLGISLSLPSSPAASFFVQIRPARVKVENTISWSEIVFPNVEDLDELFKRGSKVLPYYSPSTKKVIYSGGKAVGLVLQPDGVTLMFKGSKRLPSAVDASEALSISVDPALMDVIWARRPRAAVPPALFDASFSKQTLNAAEIYLSGKIVRHGIIKKAVEAVSDGKRAASETSEAQKIEALIDLFSKECRRFVTLGTTIRVRTHGDALVLLGEKITLTKEVYELVVRRLATSCPKNPAFMSAYFQRFGSVVRRERAALEPWEKMVL